MWVAWNCPHICIFKELHLKKKSQCTTSFQDAGEDKSISRSRHYPEKATSAHALRSRSSWKAKVMALALVTEQAWPVCTGLKQCWFSAWKGSLWGWEGRRPHGLCTCVAPRACGQRGHDAEAGPVLPTHSPGRRPRCQPLRPLPGRLPRSVCPRAGRFYKEKEHIKK